MKYILSDYDSGTKKEITASSYDKARNMLEKWIQDTYEPDISDTPTTYYVRASIHISDDDLDEPIMVPVHPLAPKCTGKYHRWESPIELVGGMTENPGVFAHGGGAKTQEVCRRCGCGRKIDTWGTYPNGVQGATYMTYEPNWQKNHAIDS